MPTHIYLTYHYPTLYLESALLNYHTQYHLSINQQDRHDSRPLSLSTNKNNNKLNSYSPRLYTLNIEKEQQALSDCLGTKVSITSVTNRCVCVSCSCGRSLGRRSLISCSSIGSWHVLIPSIVGNKRVHYQLSTSVR
jgi:hypothetical protein